MKGPLFKMALRYAGQRERAHDFSLKVMFGAILLCINVGFNHALTGNYTSEYAAIILEAAGILYTLAIGFFVVNLVYYITVFYMRRKNTLLKCEIALEDMYKYYDTILRNGISDAHLSNLKLSQANIYVVIEHITPNLIVRAVLTEFMNDKRFTRANPDTLSIQQHCNSMKFYIEEIKPQLKGYLTS